MEELIIKKIENGLRGMRLGTKSSGETNIDSLLERLDNMKSVHYEHYFSKYHRTKHRYEKK